MIFHFNLDYLPASGGKGAVENHTVFGCAFWRSAGLAESLILLPNHDDALLAARALGPLAHKKTRARLKTVPSWNSLRKEPSQAGMALLAVRPGAYSDNEPGWTERTSHYAAWERGGATVHRVVPTLNGGIQLPYLYKLSEYMEDAPAELAEWFSTYAPAGVFLCD